MGQGAASSHLGHGAAPPRQGSTLDELVINRQSTGGGGGGERKNAQCAMQRGALCETGRLPPPSSRYIKVDPGSPAAKFAAEIKASSCLGVTKDGSGSSVHDQGSDTGRV